MDGKVRGISFLGRKICVKCDKYFGKGNRVYSSIEMFVENF